jgi:uncharacterized protein
MFGTRKRPQFDVRLDDPSGTLVAGFTEYGLAGLTAVTYLTDQLDLEETGHVSVAELPAITPFENGTPRHHTRLFSKPARPRRYRPRRRTVRPAGGGRPLRRGRP